MLVYIHWTFLPGELGYFRVVMGENQLGIEQQCSWATPKSFTEINYGCYEDGSNCVAHREVEDPFMKIIDWYAPKAIHD